MITMKTASVENSRGSASQVRRYRIYEGLALAFIAVWALVQGILYIKWQRAELNLDHLIIGLLFFGIFYGKRKALEKKENS